MTEFWFGQREKVSDRRLPLQQKEGQLNQGWCCDVVAMKGFVTVLLLHATWVERDKIVHYIFIWKLIIPSVYFSEFYETRYPTYLPVVCIVMQTTRSWH